MPRMVFMRLLMVVVQPQHLFLGGKPGEVGHQQHHTYSKDFKAGVFARGAVAVCAMAVHQALLGGLAAIHAPGNKVKYATQHHAGDGQHHQLEVPGINELIEGVAGQTCRQAHGGAE